MSNNGGTKNDAILPDHVTPADDQVKVVGGHSSMFKPKMTKMGQIRTVRNKDERPPTT